MKTCEMQKTISVFGAIYFAVLIVEISLAAPSSAQIPADSLIKVSNISSADPEAVVLLYIPSTIQNQSVSRRTFILDILTKFSDAVHKSSEEVDGDEVTTFETENLLKDRINVNKNKFRPQPEISEGEPKKTLSVDFPSSEDESKENDSKTQFSEEGGPLVFQDRHNPNNILQKGRLGPNSQIQSGMTDSKRKTTEISTADEIDTNDITFDILKSSQWGSDNTIMSPFSIYNCLALLLLGAEGQTFNELAKKVRKTSLLQSSDEEKIHRFHTSFRRLLRYLNTKSGTNVSLEIANIMFTDERYPLKPSFISDAREYYDAPVNPIDFATKAELFKSVANNWVSEKTHGKIQNIVQDPSRTTTFAFINAVYFKGEWETPFPTAFTRRKDFFISPGEAVPTKLMTNQLNVPYMENEEYQMISLPYKDKKTAFFVILPREINGVEGIKSLETRLNSNILTESIQSMKSQNVAVKIPKMNIKANGQMQDVLTKMGLSSMFDSQTANFTRMSEKKGLYVSSVYHQACLDLDESGTEAYAITVGIGDRTIDEIPITFIANRPFLFFIQHIKAKTTLFYGRYLRPQITE